MRYLLYIILLTCYYFTSSAQINSGNPAKPFNSNTGYTDGIMPSNLPSGDTYGKSADAADAYDTWKSKYVVTCGASSRVLFDDKTSTVSEGIGYGMLLSAYAGDKALFDGLWQFYKDNKNGNGVMNWKIGGCSGTVGGNGATDAELDAAMALLIAEDQWPSATSPFDYISEAKTLIGNIKSHEIDNGTKQVLNGDMWSQGNNKDCRNPSYFAPGYFREFAVAVPGDAAFWNSTADAADAFLLKNRNATTGLVSNWSDPNGTPNACNGNLEYGYDACRNPWRMGIDVLWHGTGTAKTAADICSKIGVWTNAVPTKLKGPLKMDGTSTGATAYANGTFLPSFTVGIMGYPAISQTQLNKCYDASVSLDLTYENYFGETLRTIMLFVMSGNFWKPGTVTNGGGTSVVTTSITAPLNNATFAQGTAVNITATASSTNSATITNVEFLVDGVSAGSDNTAPYAFSTTTLGAGSHTLAVKATDSNSKTATSTSITITVTSTTSVVTASLTSPTNGSTAVQGTPVTFTATASSTNSATITNVEFLIDGVSAGADNSSPYSFSTSTLSAGSHTVAVKATDSNSKTFTTTTSSITITPVSNTSTVTVSLSSPTATSYTQGTAIDLTASAASTNSATITKVEFYIDNSLVNTDNAAPYTFTTTTLTAAQHSVYAKAYDSNSQTGTSTTVTFTVKAVTGATTNADMAKTTVPITVDGTIDALWGSITPQTVTKQIVGTNSSASDLSGSFKTLWDADYVYVLGEITDDIKINDSGSEPYKDDAVELYFDINNDKATTYDNNDVQYTFRWNDNSIYANPSGRSASNILFSMVGTATGYVFEARIPWSTLQGTPVKGQQIGFDFQINDDDDGGDRDGKLAWSASSDDAWENPSLFGVLTLTGTVAGIEDISYSGLKIYPNPFQSAITLEGLQGSMEYSIVDLNGRTVQTGTTYGSIEAKIPTGVYNLMLKANQDTYYNLKLIKVQ